MDKIDDSWLTITNFKIGRCPLGSGKFGKVHKCIRNDTQEMIAMKVVSRVEFDVDEIIETEIEIHSSLHHEHIVKFFGAFSDESRHYLAMEYVKGGEVYSKSCFFRLMYNDNPTILYKYIELLAKKVVRHVLLALSYCHSKNIIHRDVKPENVILDESYNAKLTDFGWSTICEGEPLFLLCGTPDYISPEMLRETGYGKEVDIWAVGVMVYDLLKGQAPFKRVTLAATYRAIMSLSYKTPKKFKANARSFIQSIFVDPQVRPSISQLLEHPFLIVNDQEFRELPPSLEMGVKRPDDSL